MKQYLGIDAGTQSVKVIALNETGNLLAQAGREYPILTPQTSFAEQEPERWWQETREAVQEVMSCLKDKTIEAIGLSGHMHGAVMLDERNQPIRPAIIWCDQRSGAEVLEIRNRVGRDLASIAGSDIFTGFMAASLLWVKNHQPEIFRSIHRVVLPKDYLKIKMGLPPSTDIADASDTLLFDITNRTWSQRILESLDFPPSLFPPLHESTAIIGEVSAPVRQELGIQGPCHVAAGAGDQHCAGLGNGIVRPGDLLITIGTGGQVFSPISSPLIDLQLRIHTFCHAVGGLWHLLGGHLSAGLSLSWMKKSVLDQDTSPFDITTLNQEASQAEAGCHGLLFLPYLIGERTPHNDPAARGAFLNLHLTHTRGHLIRAIMEGVCYALKDSVDIFCSLGTTVEQVVFAGGGARSVLWKKIMSSMLDRPLVSSRTREETATGAAMLAMLGTGLFSSAEEAARQLIHYDDPVNPEKAWMAPYAESHQRFKEAYALVKPLFPGNR